MERQTAEMIVKVYAILFWIAALTYLMVGLGLVFSGSLLSALGGGMMGLGDLEMGALGSLAGAMGIVFGVILLGFAAFSALTGFGLWRFAAWARTGAIVLSIIALFAFPLGTVVGALGIAFFGFNDDVIGLFGSSPRKTPVKKKK